MKKYIPMLATAMGGLIGSLYGYLSILTSIPEMIDTNIPVPFDYVSVYQKRYFFILLPIVLIVGGLVGKWRAAQIGDLSGWRMWVALLILAMIVAVLGYEASIIVFAVSA